MTALTIVALAGVGGLIGLIVGGSMPPMYSATTTRIVVVTGATSPDQLVTMGRVISDQAPSYTALATTSAVLQPVINQLNLQMSPSELASHVSTSTPPGTRLISITVRDEDPGRAVDIAGAVASSLAAYVPGLDDFATVEAAVALVEVDRAELPTGPDTPNVGLSALLGALLGGLCGYVFTAFVRSNSRRPRA